MESKLGFRAWDVTVQGIPELSYCVAAKTRGAAKCYVFVQAKDADYRLSFGEIHAVRNPKLDVWASKFTVPVLWLESMTFDGPDA